MIGPVGHAKRFRLIEDIAAQIRGGGDRLPGERRPAQRYSVSRGTVRSAPGEPARRELITTESGVGSFVTFDGVRLDQGVGWAQALAASDAAVGAELLGTPYVRVLRITRDADGGLVEHVVSLLDPARFRFHLTFGSTA